MSPTARTAALLGLVALLVAPRAAYADPPDPDPWFGRDKALHFSVSAGIATGGYALGTAFFDDYAGPVALGSGLALGAGIGKESLDAAGYGDPSWRDLTWDVLGTAVGIGVSVLIHAALGGPRPAAAARAPRAAALQLDDAGCVARW